MKWPRKNGQRKFVMKWWKQQSQDACISPLGLGLLSSLYKDLVSMIWVLLLRLYIFLIWICGFDIFPKALGILGANSNIVYSTSTIYLFRNHVHLTISGTWLQALNLSLCHCTIPLHTISSSQTIKGKQIIYSLRPLLPITNVDVSRH
jgi:hypothetical protein